MLKLLEKWNTVRAWIPNIQNPNDIRNPSVFGIRAPTVCGPWCRSLLCIEGSVSVVTSFKSQILIIASEVPVPKMRPSGWNWAQVKATPFPSAPASVTREMRRPVLKSENAQCWNKWLVKFKNCFKCLKMPILLGEILGLVRRIETSRPKMKNERAEIRKLTVFSFF